MVDAGLARVPRTDLARGLGALVTVPVSRAAATQRAGRAGREAPGHVYRCWSAATHERLPARAEPEIATADLTGFALELAAWGGPDGVGLALPDPPPAAAMTVARDTLHDPGRGRRRRPDHRAGAGDRRRRGAPPAGPGAARRRRPGRRRPGRRGGRPARRGERWPARGDDLVAGWRRLRAGVDAGATARWRTEVRRLRAALPAGGTDAPAAAHGAGGLSDDLAAGLLVGLAYPERLARVRRPGGSAYLMTGGTAAELAAGSGLAGCRLAGGRRRGPHPRRAVGPDPAGRRRWTRRPPGRPAGPLLRTSREVGWSDGDVVAREVTRLGAIELVQPAAGPAGPGGGGRARC